ncbi:MAG: hypothetical protein A2231_04685 [Candidatus Firestonebacteria bacterium RIFOXYA2_FULL_40_8]|nr:MAG: hypothetical protein A2231_04685 [Candidatus Firestonebacteria bacterium RIFOXYA2_FULL_40_8]
MTVAVPKRVLAAAGANLANIYENGKLALTKLGSEKIRKMGVVAAWIFAAQMFNFPVSQGTSGHLLGGIFAAVILGPFAGTLVIFIVLLVQSLFFADGGMISLGANIINMGLIGCLLSYYLYEYLNKLLRNKNIAVFIAAWASVIGAAFACSLEVGLSGKIPVLSVTKAMLGVHAIIGVAEAIITIFLLKMFKGKEESI